MKRTSYTQTTAEEKRKGSVSEAFGRENLACDGDRNIYFAGINSTGTALCHPVSGLTEVFLTRKVSLLSEKEVAAGSADSFP